MAMQICGGGGGGTMTSAHHDGSWYDVHTSIKYKELVNELPENEANELKAAICMTRPLGFDSIPGNEKQMAYLSPIHLVEYYRPIVDAANKMCELKFDSSEEDMKQFANLVVQMNAAREKNEKITYHFDLEASDFREGITEYVYANCNEDIYEYLHTCRQNGHEVWL